MRRRCISLGDIQCDNCQRIISHSESYLVTDEEDGVEVERGKTTRYCADCALKKRYISDKDEEKEESKTEEY